MVHSDWLDDWSCPFVSFPEETSPFVLSFDSCFGTTEAAGERSVGDFFSSKKTGGSLLVGDMAVSTSTALRGRSLDLLLSLQDLSRSFTSSLAKVRLVGEGEVVTPVGGRGLRVNWSSLMRERLMLSMLITVATSLAASGSLEDDCGWKWDSGVPRLCGSESRVESRPVH